MSRPHLMVTFTPFKMCLPSSHPASTLSISTILLLEFGI